MTSLLAQTHDRIAAGGRDAERIDRYVRAAAGEIKNRGDWIGLLRIDYVRSAYALRQFELGRVEIDTDHVGSHGGCDVNRRQSDAAASMHHDPFAGLHLRAIDDAVKRRHEAAAHRGRL